MSITRNYGITRSHHGEKINNSSNAVYQEGERRGEGNTLHLRVYQFLGLEFRGAIKQRAPARKFGCQRLRSRGKKKKKRNEEVARRRDKRRLYARNPRAIKNHPQLIK